MPELFVELAVIVGSAALLGFMAARRIYRTAAIQEMGTLRQEIIRQQRRARTEERRSNWLARSSDKAHRMIRQARRG